MFLAIMLINADCISLDCAVTAELAECRGEGPLSRGVRPSHRTTWGFSISLYIWEQFVWRHQIKGDAISCKGCRHPHFQAFCANRFGSLKAVIVQPLVHNNGFGATELGIMPVAIVSLYGGIDPIRSRYGRVWVFYFPFLVSFRGSRLDAEASGYIFFVCRCSMSFRLVRLLFAFGAVSLGFWCRKPLVQCLPSQTSFYTTCGARENFSDRTCAERERTHINPKDHPSLTSLRPRVAPTR